MPHTFTTEFRGCLYTARAGADGEVELLSITCDGVSLSLDCFEDLNLRDQRVLWDELAFELLCKPWGWSERDEAAAQDRLYQGVAY